MTDPLLDRALGMVPDIDAAESLAETYDPAERWRCDTDDGAEWALRKIAAAKAAMAQAHAFAERERERVADWLSVECRPHQRTVEVMEAKLADYMRQLTAENPSLRTKRLPAGELKLRAGRRRVEVTDPEAFVVWAEANYPGLLRRTVEVDKRALGELPTKDGHLVADDTGEVVPGVTEVFGDDTFTVTPAV